MHPPSEAAKEAAETRESMNRSSRDETARRETKPDVLVIGVGIDSERRSSPEVQSTVHVSRDGGIAAGGAAAPDAAIEPR